MIRDFHNEKEEKSYWFHVYLVFCLISLFFHLFIFKGEILYNSFVTKEKCKKNMYIMKQDYCTRWKIKYTFRNCTYYNKISRNFSGFSKKGENCNICRLTRSTVKIFSTVFGNFGKNMLGIWNHKKLHFSIWTPFKKTWKS